MRERKHFGEVLGHVVVLDRFFAVVEHLPLNSQAPSMPPLQVER